MTLRFPAAVPTIHGSKLHLRELTAADIPAWFARATDAESADLAGDPIPTAIDQGTAWLERHRARFREKSAIRWAIVPNGTDHCAGTIGLALSGQTAELGLVIARAHWNQGLATEATSLVLAYAAQHLALTEIQAEILDRNHASKHLFAKLGFKLLRHVPDQDPYAHYSLRIG